MHKVLLSCVACTAFLLMLGASCNPIPIQQRLPQADPCQTAEDCGDTKVFACQNNTCVALPPGGQACSYYVNGVQQNWRCEDNQWCGTQSGDCRNVPFCLNNSDCSSNQVCLNGYCGPAQQNNTANSACTSNAQCISGKLCSNGECLPAEQVLPKDPTTGELLCNSNAQCVSGKLCVNQKCVPAEQVLPKDSATGELLCNSNAQCWNGKVCINSHCVASTDQRSASVNCTTDTQCGGKGWSCTNGTCVAWPAGGQACSYYVNGVQQNWRCEENQWCGTQSGDCRNVPFCSANADCSANQVCVNGYCGAQLPVSSACSSDSQCGTGVACFQGRCTAVPSTCNYHPECLSDDFVCSNHTCIWPGASGHTCRNTNGDRWHCLNSQTCGANVNECNAVGVIPITQVSCTVDTDCGTGNKCNGVTCYTPVKNPSTCRTDAECVEKMSFCQNSTCVFAPPGNAAN